MNNSQVLEDTDGASRLNTNLSPLAKIAKKTTQEIEKNNHNFRGIIRSPKRLAAVSDLCDRFDLSPNKITVLFNLALDTFTNGNENNVISPDTIKRCLSEDPIEPYSYNGIKHIQIVGKYSAKSQKPGVTCSELLSIYTIPHNQLVHNLNFSISPISHMLEDLIIILKQRDSIDSISYIMYDVATLNTPDKTGIINSFEELLNRNMTHSVCLVSLIEVMFTRCYEVMDEGIDRHLSQSISSKIQCNKIVEDYEPVQSPDFPSSELCLNYLTDEQKYLYFYAYLVNYGPKKKEEIEKCLKDISIDEYNDNSWFIISGRIFRLYLSQSKSSPEIASLTKFIIKVCLISWFDAKINYCISDGAQVFHRILMRTNALENLNLRSQALAVLSKNALPAHPELVLISMVSDKNLQVRKKARSLMEKVEGKGLRNYVLPKLRISSTYYEMINFDECHYGVPSLLKDWNMEKGQRKVFLDIPSNVEWLKTKEMSDFGPNSREYTLQELSRSMRILRSQREFPLSMNLEDWLEKQKE